MTFEELLYQLQNIADHTDKNPVPEGEDPNQYFQAYEFNLFKNLLKYMGENSIFKVDDANENANNLILGNGLYTTLNSLGHYNHAFRSINNTDTPFIEVYSNGTADIIDLTKTKVTSNGECYILLNHNPEYVKNNTEYTISFTSNKELNNITAFVLNKQTAEMQKESIPITMEYHKIYNDKFLYSFNGKFETLQRFSSFGIRIPNVTDFEIERLKINEGGKQNYFLTVEDMLNFKNSTTIKSGSTLLGSFETWAELTNTEYKDGDWLHLSADDAGKESGYYKIENGTPIFKYDSLQYEELQEALADYIKKLPESDAESKFFLRADGSRVDFEMHKHKYIEKIASKEELVDLEPGTYLIYDNDFLQYLNFTGLVFVFDWVSLDSVEKNKRKLIYVKGYSDTKEVILNGSISIYYDATSDTTSIRDYSPDPIIYLGNGLKHIEGFGMYDNTTIEIDLVNGVENISDTEKQTIKDKLGIVDAKPYAKAFADFPTNPKIGQIIHLLFNDDANIPENATTLNTDKTQSAGYYEFNGTNWMQILNTNTAYGNNYITQ